MSPYGDRIQATCLRSQEELLERPVLKLRVFFFFLLVKYSFYNTMGFSDSQTQLYLGLIMDRWLFSF